jgi:hypothetical protein
MPPTRLAQSTRPQQRVAPPGDMNIAGGRPNHTMTPQPTRPPRENDDFANLPPADVSVSPTKQADSSSPPPPSNLPTLPEVKNEKPSDNRPSDNSDFSEI